MRAPPNSSAGKNLSSFTPLVRAILISVGVATPGSTGMFSFKHQSTTAASKPGETIYCAPARVACCACCTVSTVPAPISISWTSPVILRIAPAAAAVRNVISAQPTPPSRSARASGTASSSRLIVMTGTRPIWPSASNIFVMVFLLPFHYLGSMPRVYEYTLASARDKGRSTINPDFCPRDMASCVRSKEQNKLGYLLCGSRLSPI